MTNEMHELGDGWSCWISVPDAPTAFYPWYKRGPLYLLFLLRVVYHKIWGRARQIQRAELRYADMVTRWNDLAFSDNETIMSPRYVGGAPPEMCYSEADWKVGYGSNILASAAEPQHLRLERARAAAKPLKPIVDDRGLVWRLIEIEPEQRVIAGSDGVKVRVRTRTRGKTSR